MALYEAVNSHSGWSAPSAAFHPNFYKGNTSSSSTLAKYITSARYADKLLLLSCCVLSSCTSLRCIKVAPKPCRSRPGWAAAMAWLSKMVSRAQGGILQTNGGKPLHGAARASHRGTSSVMQIHPPVKEEVKIYAPRQKHMLFIRGWYSHTHTLPALSGRCPRCTLLFLHQWFMKDVILRHMHRRAVAVYLFTGVLWETWWDCKCSAETEEMRVWSSRWWQTTELGPWPAICE